MIGRIIFIVLIVLTFGRPISAKVVERIEAVVNTEIITTSDLEKAQKDYRDLLRSDTKPSTENPKLKEAALNKLIEDKLILQEIKRLNLEVTDAQVNNQIQLIKNNNGITSDEALRDALAAQGTSFEQWRDELKRKLEVMNFFNYLRKNSVRVQEEDLRAYYDNHPESFVDKPARRVYTLYLPYGATPTKDVKNQARALLTRIKKHGESFQSLAKRYSKGPSAESGGDIGFVEKGDLMPELEATVFKLAPKDTGMAITPKGIYLVRVSNVRPPKKRPYGVVREEIRQILAEKEAQKNLDATLKSIRDKAFVDIRM